MIAARKETEQERVMPTVDVVESGRGKFAVDITVGAHALIADEPPRNERAF